MREFYLINSKGKQWDLNVSDSFFHSIKGLGQEHKVSYLQYENEFIKEKDLLAQKTITGKIKFSSYEKFTEFSLFVQFKPLTMIYESNGRYFINVSLDKLTKQEKTIGIVSDVAFKSTGTYFKSIMQENTKSGYEGKVYPVIYPYRYVDNAKGVITIVSDTILESPTKLNIYGPVKNPSYTHYVNNEIATTGKINATVALGNKIVVDTTKIPYEIAEYTIDNEYVQSLYDMSDFSTDRFVLLKNGLNKISFVHETSEAISVSVEAQLRYESV